MNAEYRLVTIHSYKLISWASLLIISTNILCYILPILLLIYSKESNLKSTIKKYK